MIKQIQILYKNEYNKIHPFFAVYRLLYWKVIKVFKLRNITFNIWGNRKILLNYNSFQCMWLMYNYIVDWEEFNLIRDYVRPNDDVADVGSNMGYYTIWMSKFINSGKVYAFEPDKTNYSKLLNNIKLNNLNNVITSELALGNEDCEINFTTSLDGENHISPILTSNTRIVSAQTLESFFKEHNIDLLAYIKIDVEGFEYDVLRGGEALLKNHKFDIIQLEINDQIKNSGRNVRELLNLLKLYGYELYKYNAKEKKLLSITYSENRDNYFAISNIEKVVKRLNNT